MFQPNNCPHLYNSVLEISQLNLEVWCSETLPDIPSILGESGWNKCIITELSPSTISFQVLVETIDAQWEGMGDVGSARYELALLPPCLTIRVLSYSS